MDQNLLLLLALSALCACSTAQLEVTQKPSASVTPGGTAFITCSINTGDIGDGHYPTWVQQRHRGVPQLLIYTTSTRPSGVPARFSGSRSGNTMTLTITGVQAEDDGDYFCVVWSGAFIIGDGTQLNVLSGETKAPTLSIFPPSTEEIAGKKATLVCQGQNYYPASLVWSWTMNGQTINTGVDSTRPTKQTENNLFMAASFLSIDAVDWNANKLYTCIATHEGKAFQASVKQSECV